jgi:GT2 family glycosyltransferase
MTAPDATTGERGLRVCAAICTRSRPDMLRRALASVLAQSAPLAEILVVDNHPADVRTADVVTREFPGIRYVAEPVPGLDFARNRALRAASGDVVAFLDDDAVADAGWAAALAAPFSGDDRVAAVTGRVEALSLATEAQRLFEANGGFGRGRERIRLPADARRPLHGVHAPLIAWAVSVGSGCSMAVRRHALLALGGFDEALDLGPALPGGGDHDALWRLLEAGFHVVYEPAALAFHEHRRHTSEAFDQIVGHQRALATLLAKSLVGARGRRRLPVLAFLVWRLGKPLVRLSRRALGDDPLPAPVLLRMLAGTWRGLWAYPAARRIAERRRALARCP